jgi:hypothetical protein
MLDSSLIEAVNELAHRLRRTVCCEDGTEHRRSVRTGSRDGRYVCGIDATDGDDAPLWPCCARIGQ